MTRRTENADAETDNGRRAECRRNDAAAIEPIRKPPDLPLQNDTAENDDAHEDGGAGETHADPPHMDRAQRIKSAEHHTRNGSSGNAERRNLDRKSTRLNSSH